MHNNKQLTAKYGRITSNNLHRRGHEFDDIGAHLANELYSDRTHFIYELLQNAEDALARRSAIEPCGTFPRTVNFSLFPDRLEIRHFGQPFDDRDIASISDVKISRSLYRRTPELSCYFEGNRDVWFLDESESVPDDMWATLEIALTVRMNRREPAAYGFVYLETVREGVRRYYKRGVDGFDPSIRIDGLEHALTFKANQEKATFIWNQPVLPYAHCLHGSVESCTRQTFAGAKRDSQWSEFGLLVKEHAWLPHPNGGFSKPQELSLDELPSEFRKQETVARLLDMKLSSIATLAKDLGIDPVVIEYMQKNKDALRDFEEFKKWREDRGKPQKPEHEPRNLERRIQQVAQAARNASTVTSEVRPRQESSNWEEQREAKTYLREEYTNEDKELICQICGEVMPFKLDDESYYFEAIECVRGTGKELPWNHLALCPICAAKYRHANSIPPEEIKRRVLAALTTEASVTLARQEKTIWFTKAHLLDLQTALHEVG